MSPEALPEPCSPVGLLEEQGAETAASPLYSSQTKSLGETVGIAPSAQKATVALDELRAPERLDCISSTIESVGLPEGATVSVGKPDSISEGEEGWKIRFLVRDAQRELLASTTIVSLRSGRCITTLLLAVSGGDPEEAFLDNLIGRAYGPVADARTTCQ